MALKFFNNVRHLITTPGTGDIVAGAIPNGWQGLAAAGAVSTDITAYDLREGNNWEEGFITWTLSAGTYTGARTVLESSASGSAITLAGAAVLTLTLIADILNKHIVSYDRDQTADTNSTQKGVARTNLGLGTASTLASSAVVQTANNLSDITASTARTNLGLGTAAVVADGTSGATYGKLNANKTDSGANTLSGANNFTGANTFAATQKATSAAATSSSAADFSTFQRWTCAVNGSAFVFANPTNPVDGVYYAIEVNYTTSHGFSMGTNFVTTGITPSATSGKKDRFVFQYDSGLGKFMPITIRAGVE